MILRSLIFWLSRQLRDHVFAFSQFNVWDAPAPRTTAIFQVSDTIPPPCFEHFFENSK